MPTKPACTDPELAAATDDCLHQFPGQASVPARLQYKTARDLGEPSFTITMTTVQYSRLEHRAPGHSDQTAPAQFREAAKAGC